jgi:LysR family nitrogen assimilation transcriptional regulator
LTPAGEVLVRHAYAVSAQIALCRKEIQDLSDDTVRGVVRLGIAVSISRMVTMPLLRRVQSEWPSISLHIREALTAEIEHSLESGELDLGIGFHPGDPTGAERRSDTSILRAEPMYVVSAFTPSDDAWTPIHVSRLHEIPLVVTTQRYGLRRFIDQEVARWGHRLSIQLELDSLEQTMEMVVAGEARTFMLVSMCAANWRAGRVSAGHIEGLSRSPQLFIRESKLSVSRAPTVVSQVVRSVVQDLTESGNWPIRLHRE